MKNERNSDTKQLNDSSRPNMRHRGKPKLVFGAFSAVLSFDIYNLRQVFARRTLDSLVLFHRRINKKSVLIHYLEKKPPIGRACLASPSARPPVRPSDRLLFHVLSRRGICIFGAPRAGGGDSGEGKKKRGNHVKTENQLLVSLSCFLFLAQEC